LSGGTYSFPAGLTVPSALTIQAASNIAVTTGGISSGVLTVQAASNIKITAGGLTTAAANISAASNIYVGGDWTSSGLVTFGGGNYSISVIGGNWSTSGGVTFGSGNYTIDVTKVAGAKGIWSLGGTSTFGTGTYNITTEGLWTIGGPTTNFGAGTYVVQAGGWTISNATTFGNGNFNITLGGPWTISGATTLGSGNYTFKITGDLVTSANLTMGSGTYSGSMTNWTMTANATIGKGIYYLSGNLGINGNGNQTVTANNVTLVLTGATSIINYSANNSTFILSAPGSGWNAGIAVWEPTSTGSNLLASGNSSIAQISGVFYAPGADVKLLGNTGTAPACTQILAKSIEFGGNSINIQGNCSGVPGVKTFGQIIALVE
jgi:hypothetical protein